MNIWIITHEYNYAGLSDTETRLLCELYKEHHISIISPTRTPTMPLQITPQLEIRYYIEPAYGATSHISQQLAQSEILCTTLINLLATTSIMPETIIIPLKNGLSYYPLQKKYTGTNPLQNIPIVLSITDGDTIQKASSSMSKQTHENEQEALTLAQGYICFSHKTALALTKQYARPVLQTENAATLAQFQEKIVRTLSATTPVEKRSPAPAPLSEKEIYTETFEKHKLSPRLFQKNFKLFPQEEREGLLSFIIVCQNPTEKLIENINYILTTNRYSNFEIIVIDACSYEPTSVKVLQKIRKLSVSNLRIYATHDSNQDRAFTLAARIARGEYLCLLSESEQLDITVSPNIIQAFINSHVDYIFSWIKIEDPYYQIIPTYIPTLPNILIHNTLPETLFIRRDAFFTIENKDYRPILPGNGRHLRAIAITQHQLKGLVFTEPFLTKSLLQNTEKNTIPPITILPHLKKLYQDNAPACIAELIENNTYDFSLT